MKGSIYTDERCRKCGGVLRHDENRDGFFCENHPKDRVVPHKMRVHFGKEVKRRFGDYRSARQFLEGLRWKTVEGTFDYRDYCGANPLGFDTLAEKWLRHKEQSGVSKNHLRNLRREIGKAVAVWGPTNVKAIGYGEMQDLLDSLDVSPKTKAEVRSALHSFFAWVCRRERQVEMPDIPEVKFTLGWRKIVDIDTQAAIIDEVQRISWDINPKIWIGIKWLATYIAFRPNELRNLRESEINVSGYFVVPKPKEKIPKLIAMLPEDIELYNQFRGLPDLYFFRHDKGNGSAKPGSQFGKDYLYKWWKKACSNLGIEGVDLYGGTRHSTATSLGRDYSMHDIMKAGTIHKSNKAAQRYIQAEANNSLEIYRHIAERRSGSKGKVVPLKKSEGR